MTQATELTTQATPAPQTHYLSVFEDPEAFAQKMQIAAALSKTQFVPEAFRGKPEDCLVALDCAARLGLNPLAVFPEIYVIDNRASFSSKFLIAMVNRSGRFSRIEFDEGVDGSAAVTFSRWNQGKKSAEYEPRTVDNFYAYATFTELATGKEFSSPRIDMNFAERNGWVKKLGSKWQSMPEIMCRYRAAAVLIKSVCPEIVMGFEFAEDLFDAREEAQTPEKPRRVEVTAKHAPAITSQAATAAELAAEIKAAATHDDLKTLGQKIKDAHLNDAELKELRAAYDQRRKQLPRLYRPGGEDLSKMPVETPAVDETVAANLVEKWAAEVNAATSQEDLGVIARALVNLREDHKITDDQYCDLGQLIDERVRDLAAHV